MNKKASVDVAIFGGGIAGLWLLHRLRKLGFTAILFESASLGGGQTIKSQGIIHGGMKYALQGVLTGESQSMTDLPGVWRDCLAGRGNVDLQGVKILSPQQYLWAPNKFTSTVAGMAAAKTLSSKVEVVAEKNYPTIFQHADFKGQVFALDEMVLDVPSLIKTLVKANQEAVFKIEPLSDQEMKFADDGRMVSATVYMNGQALEVEAQQFIFTAGSGNELILKKWQRKDMAMQRRPLRMTMVKTPFDYPLFAHCLSLSVRPRMTITTHTLQSGEKIWYLGGAIAEEGVKRDEVTQHQAALAELSALFPWLDFKAATFASFMIDRAEPLQADGKKPETASLRSIANMTVAWPTKLALAPRLADEVLLHFQKQHLVPLWNDTRELRAWPMPCIARAAWEEAEFVSSRKVP